LSEDDRQDETQHWETPDGQSFDIKWTTDESGALPSEMLEQVLEKATNMLGQVTPEEVLRIHPTPEMVEQSEQCKRDVAHLRDQDIKRMLRWVRQFPSARRLALLTGIPRSTITAIRQRPDSFPTWKNLNKLVIVWMQWQEDHPRSHKKKPEEKGEPECHDTTDKS
jgi:hypothetical protein